MIPPPYTSQSYYDQEGPFVQDKELLHYDPNKDPALDAPGSVRGPKTQFVPKTPTNVAPDLPGPPPPGQGIGLDAAEGEVPVPDSPLLPPSPLQTQEAPPEQALVQDPYQQYASTYGISGPRFPGFSNANQRRVVKDFEKLGEATKGTIDTDKDLAAKRGHIQQHNLEHEVDFQRQTAELAQSHAKEIDEIKADRQAAREKSISEIEKMKIDPRQWFTGEDGEMGTGDVFRAIGSALAIGLGAFGAAMSKTQNSALAIIDGAIEKNIQGQKLKMRNARDLMDIKDNMYAQRLVDSKSSFDAQMTARLYGWQQVKTMLDANLAKFDMSDSFLANSAEKMKLGVEQKILDVRMQLAEKDDEAARQTAIMRYNAELQARQAYAAQAAEEDRLRAYSNDPLRFMLEAAIMQKGTGEKEAERARKEIVGVHEAQNAMKALNEFEKEFLAADPTDIIGPSAHFWATRLSEIGAIVGPIVKKNITGALSEQEQKTFIEPFEPTRLQSWLAPGKAKGIINNARQLVARATQTGALQTVIGPEYNVRAHLEGVGTVR
jgi:hypothetical protein